MPTIPVIPASSDTPTTGLPIQDALTGMEASRQALLQATQGVHDQVALALANAMKPGDIIARGLPPNPEVIPAVFVTVASTQRGRSYDAVAFEVVSAPTLVITPNNLNSCEWRCEAVPISNKTGKPMSARTGGKYRVDPQATVSLVGKIVDGFEGVPLTGDDPARGLVAFVETFRHGRPDPAVVSAQLKERKEATRRRNEAETLRRLAEDPEGFDCGIYFGSSGLLRGKGLGKP